MLLLKLVPTPYWIAYVQSGKIVYLDTMKALIEILAYSEMSDSIWGQSSTAPAEKQS